MGNKVGWAYQDTERYVVRAILDLVETSVLGDWRSAEGFKTPVQWIPNLGDR
jgi:hypothetical protein